MPTLASGVSDEELSDSEHPHFAPMKHDLDTNHDADKLITLLPPPIQNGRRSFESLSTMGSDGHERCSVSMSLALRSSAFCFFLFFATPSKVLANGISILIMGVLIFELVLQVCVTRLKALANAALSHLIMSNIYIWLTVIVEEIKESIDFSHFLSSIKNHEEFEGEDCISNYTVLLVELEESASALLYPCTVENALISASFLSIMWSNVGIKKHSSAKVIRHTHIVDFCKHVSFGFMAGFLFCSGSVISMILYITFNGSKFQNKSISIYHAMQAVLLFFMTIAAMTGHLSMRNTHKSKKHHNKMDKPLLLISLFGTFLYCLCSTISGGLVTHKIHTLEFSLLQISTTFSYALYIAQSVIQTIFVLQALRVQAGLNKTFSREFVVFLLMTNLSLWVEFMLEIKEPDINPLQEEFFGRNVWIMLSHLTGPLAIFFRFHSTVCCFDILQYAYRNPAISTYRHSSMMTNKLSL